MNEWINEWILNSSTILERCEFVGFEKYFYSITYRKGGGL